MDGEDGDSIYIPRARFTSTSLTFAVSYFKLLEGNMCKLTRIVLCVILSGGLWTCEGEEQTDSVPDAGVGGSGGVGGNGGIGGSGGNGGAGGNGCEPNCPELGWVRIEGGVFSMGSNNENREQPIHQVTIPSFEIMRTELTVAQYRVCVNAGVCSAPDCDNDTEWNEWLSCNYSHAREDHPVNYVSWIQMNEFATWAGARLPSESEWEYAARAQGQDIIYPWGNAEPDCSYANYGDCVDSTSPVCNTPQGNTAQGLCDMAGNLWEWVLDEWHENYDGAPVDGSPWCETLACANNGAYRVDRGGGWGSDAGHLRAAYRHGYGPAPQLSNLGGRLARSIP